MKSDKTTVSQMCKKELAIICSFFSLFNLKGRFLPREQEREERGEQKSERERERLRETES